MVAGVGLFGDRVTAAQAVGYTVAVAGFAWYNMARLAAASRGGSSGGATSTALGPGGAGAMGAMREGKDGAEGAGYIRAGPSV